jgi:hypothetical protein
MHAQVTTVEAFPARLDDAIRSLPRAGPTAASADGRL